MKSKSFVVVMTGLCLLTAAVFATAAVPSQSAVGTWKLDVEKSSFGNMPAPKFEQMVVSTDAPNAVKWNLKGVGADGKSYFSSYDGPVDSQPHSMMSSESGDSVAYTRSGTTLNWIIRNKEGVVLEIGSGQLSPDGKTLTLRGTMQTPKGRAAFVSVFDRIQ